MNSKISLQISEKIKKNFNFKINFKTLRSTVCLQKDEKAFKALIVKSFTKLILTSIYRVLIVTMKSSMKLVSA